MKLDAREVVGGDSGGFLREVIPDGPPKLIIFVGNPTQYHSPIFRKLNQALQGKMQVIYGDDIGARPFFNPEVNSVIEWDIPVLEGFPYKIFNNLASSDRKGFWSRNNPGMVYYVIKSPARYLLLHGYDTLSSWYVYFAAVLSGKKIIWRGETVPKPDGKVSRVEQIKRIVMPSYFRFCHRVLWSCLDNRDYLKTFLKNRTDRLVRFPCAVDNEFFRAHRVLSESERSDKRQERGIPTDHMVVATCSRLTKRKRTHLILEAMARLQTSKVTLLVVGDGPERRALEHQAQDLGVSIIVTGFVGQLEVARLLALADVFALLSVYDASPKALNEAMNFPIPIIASTGVGTARDLVHHGRNGYLFGNTRVDELAEWLDTWAANPEIRRSMGAQNDTILADYTIEEDVKNLMEILEND